MLSMNLVRLLALLPFLSFSSSRPATQHAPTRLQVTLATLHAAALTAPRPAADSVDEPYLLVSIQGPRTKTETMHLPATGHLTIHEDEALGARPLVDLNLEPGDSVRLLVSVLEAKKVKPSDEPRLLGSARLLLTNEEGATYWRALECVATCKVLSGGAAVALPASGAAHVAGVVELSGAGATYHMQLQAQRAS
jgi:hypothetical protein